MEISAQSFTIISGNSPFLISAPHAHIHRRPTLTCIYKSEEKFTDGICIDICKGTGASGIYLNKDVEYDPNFFKLKDNEYKQAVKDLIRNNKTKMFLDIHGLSDIYQYDIAIYYPSHFARSKKMAQELKKHFEKGKFKGISVNIFRIPDNDQKTLCMFTASKLRVPSLQIEIAWYIREDDELRDLFVKSISSFFNSY